MPRTAGTRTWCARANPAAHPTYCQTWPNLGPPGLLGMVLFSRHMSGYNTIAYDEVDPVSDGLHFLRDPLECEQLGISVLECPPGWTGMEHDHAADGQEEVYLLVEGEATVIVEGEEVNLDAGEALRLDPGATRQIENGDAESTFVLAGAP